MVPQELVQVLTAGLGGIAIAHHHDARDGHGRMHRLGWASMNFVVQHQTQGVIHVKPPLFISFNEYITR